MSDPDDPLTLRTAQAQVEASIQALGGYWPPLANLARLFEECGELARAVNQQAGPKQLKTDETAAAIADELGDVLYTALVLANSLGVDAQTALSGVLTKVRGRAAGDVAQPAPAPEAQPDADSSPARDRLNDRSDYQRCFVCGSRNPSGLGLAFHQEGDEVVSFFTADARYQGFPGVIHGGIVATLLDETLERVGMLERRWLMTGRLEVRYRRAAPLHRRLRIAARAITSRGRVLVAAASVAPADDPTAIIATAQGTFLPLPTDIHASIAADYPGFAHLFVEGGGDQ